MAVVASTSETTTTTPTSSPPTPAPGVYAYRTTGGERLDLLTGVERTYPSETGVVVSTTACGATLSWQPYVERSYTIETCQSGDGWVITAYENRYEFFGQAERRHLVCDPPASLATDSGSSTTTCAGDGVEEQRRSTVFGIEQLGEHRTLHVGADSETTGSTTGRTNEQLWIDLDSGVLIAYERHVDNESSSPVGAAHYVEDVSLELAGVSDHGRRIP